MTIFISYFSKEYLLGGLSSIQSAITNNPGSRGLLVCIDQEGEQLLQELSLSANISIVPFKDLVISKSDYEYFLNSRTKFEALVSIKPTLLNEISKNFEEGEYFIYLDTDIHFFESIDEFLRKNSDSSFIVFQHMYMEEPKNYPYGKYNAGFVVLKKDRHSEEILKEWSRLCSDWCFLRSEHGRYADQGYLDSLVSNPSALGALSTSINLGMHYQLNKEKLKREKGKIMINNESLICFHFHGLRIGNRLISTGLNRYGFRFNNFHTYRIIYKPIILRMKSDARNIKRIKPNENYYLQPVGFENAKGGLRKMIGAAKSLIIKTFIFYF